MVNLCGENVTLSVIYSLFVSVKNSLLNKYVCSIYHRYYMMEMQHDNKQVKIVTSLSSIIKQKHIKLIQLTHYKVS
jgi:hypothetical protein